MATDILIVATQEEARGRGFDDWGQRLRYDGTIQLAIPVYRVAQGEAEGLVVGRIDWTDRALSDPRAVRAEEAIRRAQARFGLGPKHRGAGGTSRDRDPISQTRCSSRPRCPRCHPDYYKGRHRA